LWHDLCQQALFSAKSSTVNSPQWPKGTGNVFSSQNLAERSRKVSYGVKGFADPETLFKGHLKTSLVAFWHIKHNFQSMFLVIS
jgi:hypothetical protein